MNKFQSAIYALTGALLTLALLQLFLDFYASMLASLDGSWLVFGQIIAMSLFFFLRIETTKEQVAASSVLESNDDVEN